MALKSDLFRGDLKLEACLVNDACHILPGAVGSHVSKIQQALLTIGEGVIAPEEYSSRRYGTSTATAVLAYKKKRNIINRNYQNQADNIVGRMTIDALDKEMAAWQRKGPHPLRLNFLVPDIRRQLVLRLAHQHLGAVDFQQQQNGRPKGLDFLIDMFEFAASVKLTEHNFKDPKNQAWTAEPWINDPKEQRKSWCGIFCVYCYRNAGYNVSWNLKDGKPVGQIKLTTWSPSFVADIRPADIGCVRFKNHHFLIESVDGSGPVPPLSSIDGNTDWGRILRCSTATHNAHRVGTDNFNYYSIV